MATPAERRALLFLSVVLALGAGVRASHALRAAPPPPDAAARADLHRQIVAVDSADSALRLTGGKRRRGRRPSSRGYSSLPGAAEALAPDSATPRKRRKAVKLSVAAPPKDIGVSPGGPIDLDRAQEWEILALPKVGPMLAHRIIANRDSLGPFGSIEELKRVKGVGDALASTISPYVTFSLQPRQSEEREREGMAPQRRIRRRRSSPQ
jgi:hypothetical protein